MISDGKNVKHFSDTFRVRFIVRLITPKNYSFTLKLIRLLVGNTKMCRIFFKTLFMVRM